MLRIDLGAAAKCWNIVVPCGVVDYLLNLMGAYGGRVLSHGKGCRSSDRNLDASPGSLGTRRSMAKIQSWDIDLEHGQHLTGNM